MSGRTTVLHLAGSAETPFYQNLSLVYARAGMRFDAFDHRVALVQPGGLWRLGSTYDDLGPALTAPAALAELEAGIDLVVPYMFDVSGMTSFRSLFEDVLGIPVVGSTAAVNGAAADKALTKAILSAAGIPVPADHSPDSIDAFPVIVKPGTEDNSRGISLVYHFDQLEEAIAAASAFGAPLIEQFIAGREIRLAVVEGDDGELLVPPMIEYVVSDEHPIRSLDNKLALDDRGHPVAQNTGGVPAICPAPLSDELRDRLARLGAQAHRALGCRDYSLFDLRIDRLGNPYVLEAGLFWTFGEPSMITKMLRSGGPDPEPIIENLWRRAARRSGEQLDLVSLGS